MLLGKIKEFLTSLKKQQYGKHIVLRIEKLLANAAEWIAKVHCMAYEFRFMCK